MRIVLVIITATVGLMAAAIPAVTAFAPRCPADYPAIMSGDYMNIGGCR